MLLIGYIHRSPSVGRGSGIAESYDVGLKYGSDPELQWLWLWLAAVALIRLLAWELPYATDAALKRKNKNKNKTTTTKNKTKTEKKNNQKPENKTKQKNRKDISCPSSLPLIN